MTIPAAQHPGSLVPLRVIANDDSEGEEVKRLLQPEQHRVTFADVGGHDDIKRQIEKRIITPFLKPSLFERFKKRVGGGILMYGPPGCGKTLLARATSPRPPRSSPPRPTNSTSTPPCAPCGACARPCEPAERSGSPPRAPGRTERVA